MRHVSTLIIAIVALLISMLLLTTLLKTKDTASGYASYQNQINELSGKTKHPVRAEYHEGYTDAED